MFVLCQVFEVGSDEFPQNLTQSLSDYEGAVSERLVGAMLRVAEILRNTGNAQNMYKLRVIQMYMQVMGMNESLESVKEVCVGMALTIRSISEKTRSLRCRDAEFQAQSSPRRSRR